MSYLNTQISLLQGKFFRHYLSLIVCMTSVKTSLAVVGVIKFVADIQQDKLPFVRNYTYFKTFPEQ